MKALHFEFDKLLNPKTGSYVFQYIHSRRLSNVYHSHDFYEIMFVICGWCMTVINGTQFSVGTHDLCILRPGDCHKFCEQSDDLQLVCLSVQKDEFETLADAFDKTLKDKILHPTEPTVFKNCPKKTISGFVQFVYNTANKEDDYKLLLFYFLKIYRAALDDAQKDIPSNLTFALNEIRKRENMKLGVSEFIRLSNYSRSQLDRLMKKHFNTTLHNYILDLRLDAAYNDLVLTGKNSEEISEDVGFKSFSHFNKVFKEKYNITPAALRKSHGIWTS